MLTQFHKEPTQTSGNITHQLRDAATFIHHPEVPRKRIQQTAVENSIGQASCTRTMSSIVERPMINEQFVCLLHRQYCDILIDSRSSDSWLLGYRV